MSIASQGDGGSYVMVREGSMQPIDEEEGWLSSHTGWFWVICVFVLWIIVDCGKATHTSSTVTNTSIMQTEFSQTFNILFRKRCFLMIDS